MSWAAAAAAGASVVGGYLNSKGSKNKNSGKVDLTTQTDMTETSLIQKMDPAARAILSSLVGRLNDSQAAGASTFTRENAIADTSGIVQNILQQSRESALPNILGASAGGGAYSGTTQQILANDANARAVSQSASVVSQAITNYGQLQLQEQQQRVAQLMSALGLSADSTVSTTATKKGTERTAGTDFRSQGAGGGGSLGGSLLGGLSTFLNTESGASAFNSLLSSGKSSGTMVPGPTSGLTLDMRGY